MKLQKNYILLSVATLLFFGLMILLSMLLLAKANIFPGAIWDAISFVIVNIGAYVLFMIAFGNVKKNLSTKKFKLPPFEYLEKTSKKYLKSKIGCS